MLQNSEEAESRVRRCLMVRDLLHLKSGRTRFRPALKRRRRGLPNEVDTFSFASPGGCPRTDKAAVQSCRFEQGERWCMSLAELFYRKNPRRPSFLSRLSRRSHPPRLCRHSVLSPQPFCFEPLEPRVLLSAAPAEVATMAEAVLPQADPPVPLVIERGEDPGGSLIHIVSADGANFGAGGEVDSYSIDLDAGQKLSALLFPAGNASLQGKIELFNPSGGSLGVVPAPAPGLGAVIPNIADHHGRYLHHRCNQPGGHRRLHPRRLRER